MKAASTRIPKDKPRLSLCGWGVSAKVGPLIVIVALFFYNLNALRTSTFDTKYCRCANDRVATETQMSSGPFDFISSEQIDGSFHAKWSEIKSRICPDGLPSHEKYGE